MFKGFWAKPARRRTGERALPKMILPVGWPWACVVSCRGLSNPLPDLTGIRPSGRQPGHPVPSRREAPAAALQQPRDPLVRGLEPATRVPH